MEGAPIDEAPASGQEPVGAPHEENPPHNDDNPVTKLFKDMGTKVKNVVAAVERMEEEVIDDKTVNDKVKAIQHTRNVKTLRQMSEETLADDVKLYEPNLVIKWDRAQGPYYPYGHGIQRFYGQNRPSGAQIFYHLANAASEVGIKIFGPTGEELRELGVWRLRRLRPLRRLWGLCGIARRPTRRGAQRPRGVQLRSNRGRQPT